MSRYHFLGRAVDTYGNAQPNIGVTINLANTLIRAIVYANQTGGVPTSAAPQITTDAYGRFSFWVDTDNYAVTQFFDITAEGLTYEDIDIFRGFTDHGLMTGLADDDHPQYSTDIEYDELVASYNAHAASASVHFTEASIVTDHGGLTGLEDDDHPQYMTDTIYNAHAASASVHFTEASIDHTNIQSIGTNTHTEIDSHIASAGVHFTEASIDHGSISGLEDDDHPQYMTDTIYNAHAASASVHFTEASIDHGSISGLEDDDHPQYMTDTIYNAHAASASVHFTEGSIDHTNILSIGINTHAQIDTKIGQYNAHAASASVHFTEASINLEQYALLDGTRNFTGNQIFEQGVEVSAGHLLLPQDADAVTPTLAFGDGDSGLYQYADNFINVSLGGVDAYQFGASRLTTYAAGGGIYNEVASSTNPTLTPNWVDSDTGIGWTAADQLSLVAGGVEGIRITEDGTIHVDINGSIELSGGTVIDDISNSASVSGSNKLLTALAIQQAIDTNVASIVTDHGGLTGLEDDDHPQYMTDVIYNAHAASASVHFTEASIDHANIQNIGTNTHAEIDSHIASAGVHFTEASIDHGNLTGLDTGEDHSYINQDVQSTASPSFVNVSATGVVTANAGGTETTLGNLAGKARIQNAGGTKFQVLDSGNGLEDFECADILVTGNGIHDSLGQRITFDGAGKSTFAGNLDVDGNAMTLGDGGSGDPSITFTSGNSGSLTWKEDEKRLDFDPNSNASALRIYGLDAANEEVDLYVTASDILKISKGIDITGNIVLSGTVDGIDVATDVAANTSARHTQGTDTTLGTMTADIDMNSLFQVVNLQAPANAGEALRQTVNITEADLEQLTDGSDTALHVHSQYTTDAIYNAHAASASVHFTEASIDHANIQNIGTNTHAEIDSHIASAGVHFTEASIDHGALVGLEDDDHPQYMTDVIYNAHAASASVHFTEASIDHANIQSIGTNTHTEIDSHIASAGVHFTEASIDHVNIQNVGTNTHTEIDSHIASAGVHFTEASIDHGSIAGLEDDDHTQYSLVDGTRNFTGNVVFDDGIEVSAGSLQLSTGVAVNEISDESSSIDSDQLLTASAIQEAISGVGTTAADIYQDLLLDSIYTYVTYDDFGDQTLVDTGNSTMDYSTSGSRYDFTAGEILQSIDLLDPTSPSAGLYILPECMASIDYEDTGTPTIHLSTDGSNWEETTVDDIHTFSASALGSGLYVRYTAGGTGKVKSWGALYYPDTNTISTTTSRRKYVTFYYEGISVDEDIIVDGFYFDGSIAIDKMTIHARAAPSASNLTVDLLKDGAEQSNIGTLTAGLTYEKTTLATPIQYITTDRLGLKIKSIGSVGDEGEGLNIIIHYYDRE